MRWVLGLLLVLALTVMAVACEEEGEEGMRTASPTATARASPAATPEATPTPGATPMPEAPPAGLSLNAASVTITIDGDNSDWANIDGLSLTLKQCHIPPGSGIDFDPVEPRQATLKVATDAENIYVLFEVADDFDFDPEDHNLSASPNVQFLIEQPAETHVGAELSDLDTSLGMIDIWHWELDCGPGELSGGVSGISGGSDPDCNLDDEYSTSPEEREDDDSPQAENSLSGVWDHSARAQGPGAHGVWIFEFSRPLQTGDPQDAQFTSGGTAFLALTYFDPDESATGWSDAGHLTSAEEGLIQVNLP